MTIEILVHAATDETWVAVLEDKSLIELYVEQGNVRRTTGNIYKGRIQNVLPGMEAAFVDIGLERNAFLHLSDALPAKRKKTRANKQRRAHTRDTLKRGQSIIVQVVKEPGKTKGAQVTTRLSFPGRNMVLMPGDDRVGVSRRIDDKAERERLRHMAGKFKPAGAGLVVRTAAIGIEESEFCQDVSFLVNLWKKTKQRGRTRKIPKVLHQDLDLEYKIVRDLFTPEVERFVVDSRDVYERTLELLRLMSPGLIERVEYFDPSQDLLLTYGLEADLEKAFRRRVWLKCGGYIVLDQTEALTAIDVNTGKYTGRTSLPDTVLKTNLEAVEEIARQLRLRNISGIIVVDFIDMDNDKAKKKVVSALERELARDKVKASVSGPTKLGLVEIARKKERRSLENVFLKACPGCDGKGKVLSEHAMVLKIRREIHRLLSQETAKAMLVETHPSVAAVLIGSGGQALRLLERNSGISIQVRGADSYGREQFTLTLLESEERLWEIAVPLQVGEIVNVLIEEQHVSKSEDAVARVEGFVINVEGGADHVGKRLPVEITAVQRTHAKARVVESSQIGALRQRVFLY